MGVEVSRERSTRWLLGGGVLLAAAAVGCGCGGLGCIGVDVVVIVGGCLVLT